MSKSNYNMMSLFMTKKILLYLWYKYNKAILIEDTNVIQNQSARISFLFHMIPLYTTGDIMKKGPSATTHFRKVYRNRAKQLRD